MVNVVGYITSLGPAALAIGGEQFGCSLDVQKFLRYYKQGDAVYANHVNGTISYLSKYETWAAKFPDRAAGLPLPPMGQTAPVAGTPLPVAEAPQYSRVNEERLMNSSVSCATGIIKSLIEAGKMHDMSLDNIRSSLNYLTMSIFNDQYEILTGEKRE